MYVASLSSVYFIDLFIPGKNVGSIQAYVRVMSGFADKWSRLVNVTDKSHRQGRVWLGKLYNLVQDVDLDGCWVAADREMHDNCRHQNEQGGLAS